MFAVLLKLSASRYENQAWNCARNRFVCLSRESHLERLSHQCWNMKSETRNRLKGYTVVTDGQEESHKPMESFPLIFICILLDHGLVDASSRCLLFTATCCLHCAITALPWILMKRRMHSSAWFTDRIQTLLHFFASSSTTAIQFPDGRNTDDDGLTQSLLNRILSGNSLRSCSVAVVARATSTLHGNISNRFHSIHA